MHTARDVASAFERICPRESGLEGDELGFVYGDPATPVTGVACLWNVHTSSIRACISRNLNMLLCHESAWMPAQQSPWYEGPKDGEIAANQMRRQLLDQHRLVVYRSHSNWDGLPGDGVADQAVAALGIEGLKMVARQRFFSIQELPHAMCVRDMKDVVERGLRFSGCRLFGDGGKTVKRFAFLVGGFGENQYNMPQAARDMGAETLIIGEMSEFIVIASLEMGLPVIESLHSVSESPALRRQAVVLAQALPGVNVEYVPSGALAFGL